MEKLLAGVVAAALMFVCSGTGASPITNIVFDLTGTGLNTSGRDTFSSTQSGITLTATGWQWYSPYRSGDIGDSVTFSNQRDITQDTSGGDQGLGVDGGDSDRYVDDDDREAIRFLFSESVNLVSVLFNKANNDAFDFILNDIFTLDGIDMSSNDFTWTPGTTFNGTSFGFGADDGGFQIRELTVARPAPPTSLSLLPPSSVPEPSVLALFGLGLMLFALYRREVRQKS